MRAFLIGLLVLSHVCETAVLAPDRLSGVDVTGSTPSAVIAADAEADAGNADDSSASREDGSTGSKIEESIAALPSGAAAHGSVQPVERSGVPEGPVPVPQSLGPPADESPGSGMNRLMQYEHYGSKECQAKLDEEFKWAKFVIAFGVLGVLWVVVGLFLRFQFGSPRFRATMVVFAVMFTIAWLVLCFATDRVLRRMFEAALRSTICPLHA